MTIQVEEYIESIEKSELRIIFRLYFLDDLSYPKVARSDEQNVPEAPDPVHGREYQEKIQRDILKMSPMSR